MKYILIAFLFLFSFPAFAQDNFTIEVIKSEHTLILRKNGDIVGKYDVIYGKPGRETPNTEAWFNTIDINPTWHPTPRGIKELNSSKELFDKEGAKRDKDGNIYSPPGPKNPLGKARLNLQHIDRSIKIHGTNEPELFETNHRNYSWGCIRVLKIKDLVETIVGQPIDWDKDYTIKMPSTIKVTIH